MKKQLLATMLLLSAILPFSHNRADAQIDMPLVTDSPAALQPFSTVPPAIAVKTNLLYDLTATLNLGFEFRIGSRYTLDVSANYNPWTFRNHKKIKHLLMQPEFRIWTCEPFSRHFFGVHAIYAQYNIGGILNMGNKRYQGDAYGVGISYGYQWYLSPRWNIEATIGAGYVYLDYKTYECGQCRRELAHGPKHYFGPTKVGISLIHIIK